MSRLISQFLAIKRVIPTKQVSHLGIRQPGRAFTTSHVRLCEESADNKPEAVKKTSNLTVRGTDRTQVIPVETSIRYLRSAAYKEAYGEQPVWVLYRRNHKGPHPPRKTRKTCIRAGIISTGNPCPICRDEYLVLDHNNLELLKQFISPYSGEVLSYTKTGLCQMRHNELIVAIERAIDRGYLTFDVPFRYYDYAEYYKPEKSA
ncbi:28S ribosomal protein S18b, mitochondrial [Lutzomyia longipalpis]|uniref:28S ribosomal protein S18b, mitochondrial n=1 Tax=Lutzomyia longipalpis TaxID=7200 RepID=UPI0024841D5B|nr:28S ribosomal protein S18b, mitochondrial [Lutzomyia longipalpis]